ncbi:ZN567 protein, partial [Polyodon spathula]|nr:zinc finger and SCAN domain-containing protein 12-like isoform X2 [Polyodon spathula]XP_041124492.1 zinc finger and SCAN domain-containing protein 12-like isoform X2 [Polyodon spathula]MBN3284842.1 ZN567 protein [Polyodon spathula]
MTEIDHRANIEERGGRQLDQLICGECRSEFRQISEFIHHKAEHTTGSGSYLCELCGRCFLSRTVLAYHYRSTHKLQPAGSPLHNPPRCEDVVATQDAASENDCLGLLLVLEPETRGPLDNQDGKCVDIESLAVPESGALPKNTSSGGFDCPVCGKVFQKHRFLQRHSETHRPRRDFLCERCGKTFASRSRLVAHRQRHMAAPRVYSCPQCEFSSALPALAQAHRQLHAVGCQRCPLCGNVYTDRATLRKHMRVHAQERPYECSQQGCGWRFKTEVMLKAHVRAHTSRGGFECPDCGYPFRRKHHLQRHQEKMHGAARGNTRRRAWAGKNPRLGDENTDVLDIEGGSQAAPLTLTVGSEETVPHALGLHARKELISQKMCTGSLEALITPTEDQVL